jgi:uncharacterized membrane protein YjfL (UPF0719 family)
MDEESVELKLRVIKTIVWAVITVIIVIVLYTMVQYLMGH